VPNRLAIGRLVHGGSHRHQQDLAMAASGRPLAVAASGAAATAASWSAAKGTTRPKADQVAACAAEEFCQLDRHLAFVLGEDLGMAVECHTLQDGDLLDHQKVFP
jgi:hypothetical protein